jgi:hypothetical protein
MLLALWKKAVTNNHRFSPDQIEYLQTYLLNILLISSTVVCLLNALTNIVFFKCYLGAAIEILTIPFSIATWFFFIKQQSQTALYLLF